MLQPGAAALRKNSLKEKHQRPGKRRMNYNRTALYARSGCKSTLHICRLILHVRNKKKVDVTTFTAWSFLHQIRSIRTRRRSFDKERSSYAESRQGIIIASYNGSCNQYTKTRDSHWKKLIILGWSKRLQGRLLSHSRNRNRKKKETYQNKISAHSSYMTWYQQQQQKQRPRVVAAATAVQIHNGHRKLVWCFHQNASTLTSLLSATPTCGTKPTAAMWKD